MHFCSRFKHKVTSTEPFATPRALVPYTPLQTRLGIVLGLLIVALSLALAFVLGEVAERRLMRLSATNLGVLTEQVARELSTGMNQFAKDVLTQTHRDLFRKPDASPDAMRSALEDFRRENPEFSFVAILDADTGRVEAAAQGVYEGGDLRGRPVFEQGRLGLALGDVHDAVRLASLLPKPVSGEPLRFLDVAAPIRDASGAVTRVFATHIGWEWTSQVRENVLGPIAQRQGVEIFLLDTASRVVLAASPGSPDVGSDLSVLQLWPSREPVQRRWSDGADYLTAVAATQPRGNFPGFGWRVVARQPYEITRASVRNLQYGFLAGGLVIGLGAAGLAWWLTGRMFRPLRRLADQAERVDAGAGWQPSNLPDASHGDDVDAGEVAAVKRAFRHLADSARTSADANITQLRQFETLAASLAQGVYQADAQGRIEYLNHDWIRAGKPEGEFTIADIEGLLHEGDRDAFRATWQTARAETRDMVGKFRLNLPENTQARWFEIRARAIKGANGAVLRWVGTLFDIDDITRLNEATRRAFEEEQSARMQADRAARIRDEFLATVSHELRSPLNAITGWSEILAKKRTDDPMIAKAAQSIRRNARHQASLIDDLLDMTSVMAGKMIIQPTAVDLAESARNIFLAHLHSAQEKGVELICREAEPVVVDGDSRRLEQVLSNLVGNAIKFTEAGGRVEMEVQAVGGQAEVRVRDTGRGIRAEFLPHVFDRMRQEDGSVTRRSGGLGLGLAIARGVVELHGGHIEAASAGSGRGATFTVRFPLSAGALPQAVGARGAVPPTVGGKTEPDPEADTEADGALRGLRVLLVDDEPDAREVAHVALAGFGAAVRAAPSAAEALEILGRESFDLLVSDIGMPGMDGLTFIRRLRAEGPQAAQRMPAVALTAFAMESDIRAGMEAGFQAYVAKPISLQRLRTAVLSAMAHA